jgi:hypothetical protein
MADFYVNSSTGSDSNAGTVGAPFATIQKGLDSHAAAGDRVIVQAGSGYTITSSLTKSTNQSVIGSSQPNVVVGCTSTIGDGGRPVITLSGSSITAFAITSFGWWIDSFEIDCANQTSSKGALLPRWSTITNCIVRRFTSVGIDMTTDQDGSAVIENYVYDGASGATSAIRAGGRIPIVGNVVKSNACTGIIAGGSAVSGNVVYGNSGSTSDGITFTYGTSVEGNVVANNGRDGIRCADFILGPSVRHNVIISNGAFGIRYTGSQTIPQTLAFNRNAFYNNTSGSYSKITAGASDVALTADPFVDAANGNFALNSTSGGGATLRALNFQLPSISTTRYPFGGWYAPGGGCPLIGPGGLVY